MKNFSPANTNEMEMDHSDHAGDPSESLNTLSFDVVAGSSNRPTSTILDSSEVSTDTEVVENKSLKRLRKLTSKHLNKGCYKTRNIITLMLFLGMTSAYCMRTNLALTLISLFHNKMLFSLENKHVSSSKCSRINHTRNVSIPHSGPYEWTLTHQDYIMDAFYYGYCFNQILMGVASQKFGFKLLLGIGMIINTILGFLTPVLADYGLNILRILRFIQGVSEAPVIPCSHSILANWSPPNEISRRVAIVYSGAQVGSALSLPLSALFMHNELLGGWPSLFFIVSSLNAIWLIGFYIMVFDDPHSHPRIFESEKLLIISKIWGVQKPKVKKPKSFPLGRMIVSLPFWAIMVAHIGNSYGYETLMVHIPKFMFEILYFDINNNELMSALPYCVMWVLALMFSFILDELITADKLIATNARKIGNCIGQMGPAMALICAGFTECNVYLTVAILTIGAGLNSATYSGFFANHIDIAPNFAGILISITNCTATVVKIVESPISNSIFGKTPSIQSWRRYFVSTGAIYFICSAFYLVFASAKRCLE